jgi:peptide/nickel transport system substrate-binding protein
VADPCARQLEINTTVAPWDNANMRRAVAHIIDRTQIVNIAAEGATTPSRTMFPEYGSMAPFIDAVVEAGYGLSATADVEAGQALIEAEGWVRDGDYYTKDGETLSVEIHVNSASTEYTRTIDMVVEQLQRAGIDARSVPVENSVFWGEVLPFGAYEMSYSWLSCGSVNEPWASMGRYTVADVVPVGERSPASTTPALGHRGGRGLFGDRQRHVLDGAGRSGDPGHGGRGLPVSGCRNAVHPAGAGLQAASVQHDLLGGVAVQ